MKPSSTRKKSFRKSADNYKYFGLGDGKGGESVLRLSDRVSLHLPSQAAGQRYLHFVALFLPGQLQISQ